MAEIILTFFGETHYKAGTTKKFYGHMSPHQAESRIAAIKNQLNQACKPCPLRNDCLPEARIGLGRSVIFKATKSTGSECLLPKTEKGSLRLELNF